MEKLLPHSQPDTVVQAISGAAECRSAAAVDEWRIEDARSVDGIVISMVTRDGASHSFLVSPMDAEDMAEVLRRKTIDR